MRRKEIILFMTVGTGVSSHTEEEGFNSLARKLYSTINKIYPHHVVFFASDKSEQTVKYIKDLFVKDGDEFVVGEDYHIARLNAIDDFNACFEVFESKIWEYEYSQNSNGYQIIMDYTSGTKTMSAAMACCGMFYRKDLISIGGDRSTGEVSAGTELINFQNLYKIYDRFVIVRSRHNFNSNHFMECIDIINNIVDLNIHKDSFLNLCKGYYAWDIMEFEEAYNYLKEVNTNHIEIAEIKEDIKRNLNALGMIVNSRSQNLRNCYVLASLINNSARRAEEYKYDDAIARLYRSFELIAQIRLSKYDIDSSDVDTAVLLKNGVASDFIKSLEKTREDGKIRTGLVKDYMILNELGDELGKIYLENENKIKNLTQKRNNSILAHGLDSQSKDDFEEFYEVVLMLVRKLDRDMNRFLRETKFAKFDLKLNISQK